MGKATIASDSSTVWQLLALPDDQLEGVDLVVANLAVARGLPALADLDVPRYRQTVDDWTTQFAANLPDWEQRFRQAPERFKNDVRFFRVGQLAGFLGHVAGIRYIEEQREATSVRYTDPSDLFLNGVIDTRRGTCGNMAALHVAVARRLGWPVSLACAAGHFISRYDDGEVVHNIEMSRVEGGTYASDPDEVYVEKFKLPRVAVECGSDLRRLTMREMIGTFLALRGRHRIDVGLRVEADGDYALSRVVFPTYRRAYIAAMVPALRRGATLFAPGEVGHPDSLFEDLAPTCSPQIYGQHRGNGTALGRTVTTLTVPTLHVMSLPASRRLTTGQLTP